MAFETLPLELQNIITFKFQYISKWLVFFIAILLSIYYIFFVWKNHKPTKFIVTFIYRIIFFSVSIGVLFASPFILLNMAPEYSFYSFYNMFLVFYSILISITGILIFIDIIRYGILGMLNLAGFNVNDSNVKEIIKGIENNKHFLKFNKIKKNGRY